MSNTYNLFQTQNDPRFILTETNNPVISGGSVINAGEGDDTILVSNETDIIQFSRGDGNDFIESLDGVTINLGDNITSTDISIAREGRNVIISVADTNDSLTLDVSTEANINLIFSNDEILTFQGNRNSSESIRGEEARRRFEETILTARETQTQIRNIINTEV